MRYILFPLLILLLVWTGCTATHRVKTMSLSPTPLPTKVIPYRGPTTVVVTATPSPTPEPTSTPTPTATPEPKSVLDIIDNYRSQIAKVALENGNCSVDNRIQSTMRWWSNNSLAYIRAYSEVPDLTPEDVALVKYFLDSERGRHARLCRQ